MAFMIARRNGRFGMRAFCDWCGEEVIDGHCNILSPRQIEEGCEVEIKIACKVGCTHGIDPKNRLANMELGACILYLKNNAKIDDERARRMIELEYA